MTFEELGLIEPLCRAVAEKGYRTPSPIQTRAIPVVLNGEDLMASAQTGTGKTAAFVLPLLQRLRNGVNPKKRQARALIVTPTRELAAQVHQSFVDYGKHLKLRSAVVFGGVNINPQISKLSRGVDILVATPGRLLDLHQQHAVDLSAVDTLVLDEADRMLDMGFIHDIKRIQRLLPEDKLSLLFSATFSPDIRQLAKTMLKAPVEVDVAPRNTTVETVAQCVHPVDKAMKAKLLIHLIRDQGWSQVLVFSRTKHGANKLAKQLDKAGIGAAAIHGNKSQPQRTRALADFKAGKIGVLVATDIAARGIDIDALPHVVNFDLPNVPEDYVHRIGRTGRAGSQGEAVSLVSAEEAKLLRDIERFIDMSVPRKIIEDFEPEQALPETARHQKKANQSRSSGAGNGARKPDQATRRRRRPQGASSNGNEGGNAPQKRSGRGADGGSSHQKRPGSNGRQETGNSRDSDRSRHARNLAASAERRKQRETA